MKTFEVKIEQLQPSQIYINQVKLEKVKVWLTREHLPVLPVIKIAGKLVLTDGHTRAVAALLAGCEKIPVCFDEEDELDLESYQTYVAWAVAENIDTPRKLMSRIISETDFQRLWIDRCEKLGQELKKKKEK